MTRQDLLALMGIAIGLGQLVFLWFMYCKISQVWTIAKREEAADLMRDDARERREWEDTQGWRTG
jgi:hypothetical protein